MLNNAHIVIYIVNFINNEKNQAVGFPINEFQIEFG